MVLCGLTISESDNKDFTTHNVEVLETPIILGYSREMNIFQFIIANIIGLFISDERQIFDNKTEENKNGVKNVYEQKKSIENRHNENKYIGKEQDSLIQEYTILFDSKSGNTYQKWEVHKDTKKGRIVSKPYKKKK